MCVYIFKLWDVEMYEHKIAGKYPLLFPWLIFGALSMDLPHAHFDFSILLQRVIIENDIRDVRQFSSVFFPRTRFPLKIFFLEIYFRQFFHEIDFAFAFKHRASNLSPWRLENWQTSIFTLNMSIKTFPSPFSVGMTTFYSG